MALIFFAPIVEGTGDAHSPQPAQRWEALFEHLESVSSFSASFNEERHQSFRRTAQRFSGVLRAHETRGVAFHYQERRERLFLIRDNTLLDATDGRPEAVSISDDARDLILAVSRIVQWDRDWIERNFRLSGSYENTEWELALEPSSARLDGLLIEIVIHGSDTDIRKIIIHQTRNRRVEFSIESIEIDPSWSSSELDTYFPPDS